MSEVVQQSKSVAALIALIQEDLPVCSWIVFVDSGLEGWIVDDGDPEFDTVEAMQRWARKFGTGVMKNGKVLITHGTSGHVPIRVLAKDVYS